MTKEEKIKEAWGLYFEHLGEHAKKHALENNGYCSAPSITLGLILRRHGEEWLETNKDLKNRPKSLQGIEDNNGWIKVESEADLPKESYNYWVFQNDGLIQSMKEYELNKKYYNIEATHYQPIQKPKPPIY